MRARIEFEDEMSQRAYHLHLLKFAKWKCAPCDLYSVSGTRLNAFISVRWPRTRCCMQLVEPHAACDITCHSSYSLISRHCSCIWML